MTEIGRQHIPPQNIAFAGVAKPINDSCWRSSTLNLARRKAEKAAISNAMPAHHPKIGLSQQNSIIDGANPNVISSAKESNSTPMGLGAFNTRALNPSKKSKNAPAKINTKAHMKAPCVAKKTAILPQSRLQLVMVSGIIRFVIG